jgi:hypothetical protein
MAGRVAFLPDHGATVPGPPVKWRPRPLTIKEKLEIVVRQMGKEPGGARLNPLDGIDSIMTQLCSAAAGTPRPWTPNRPAARWKIWWR